MNDVNNKTAYLSVKGRIVASFSHHFVSFLFFVRQHFPFQFISCNHCSENFFCVCPMSWCILLSYVILSTFSFFFCCSQSVQKFSCEFKSIIVHVYIRFFSVCVCIIFSVIYGPVLRMIHKLVYV